MAGAKFALAIATVCMHSAMPRVFKQRQVFCREHNTYHYADRYCSSCRIDELKAENSLLEQKLEVGLDYIKTLEAGFASEEEQDYVHNEVTGLHNTADLYRIEALEARLERKDEALTEIANSGVRVHTGFNWIATMAEQALGEQE